MRTANTSLFRWDASDASGDTLCAGNQYMRNENFDGWATITLDYDIMLFEALRVHVRT